MDDLHVKFVRLEADQGHMAKTLDRLTDISEQMNRTLNQLTSQQTETKRLAEQVKSAERRMAEFDTRFALIAEAMLPLDDLKARLTESTTITTLIKWVAAVIATGAVTLIFTMIERSIA